MSFTCLTHGRSARMRSVRSHAFHLGRDVLESLATRCATEEVLFDALLHFGREITEPVINQDRKR
jgi:hypothetical protein